jgi:hypothetical protein
VNKAEDRNSIELEDKMTSLEKVKTIRWIRSNMKHRKVKKYLMPYLLECLMMLNADVDLTIDQIATIRKIRNEEREKRRAYISRKRAELAAEMKDRQNDIQ